MANYRSTSWLQRLQAKLDLRKRSCASWFRRLLATIGLRRQPVPSLRIKLSNENVSDIFEFRTKPLGIEFSQEVPPLITRVRPESAAEVLGVKKGFQIDSINGKSALRGTFKEVSKRLKEGIAPLPERKVSGTIKARRKRQPALAELIETFSHRSSPPMETGISAGVRVSALLPDSIMPDPGFEDTMAWTVWSDELDEDKNRGGALVFIPKDAQPGACVLYIHGGAFEHGSSHDPNVISFCSRLAADSKAVVVCPDHLLSGEGREFEAAQIMKQLLANVIWLWKNDPVTQKARGDAARIMLAGDSSGATQALSLLLQVADKKPGILDAVKGCALISPWLDLSCGSHSYVSNAFSPADLTGDVMFQGAADENAAAFRNCAIRYVGSKDELKDRLFSPYWLCRDNSSATVLSRLEKAQIPLWMCVGAAETLSGEVLDFAQRLRGKLPIEMWLHEGAFHVWLLFNSTKAFQSKTVARDRFSSFIQRATNSEPGWPHVFGQDTPKSIVKEGIHYHIDDW
eukprot:TRINITY_DN5160_c0_g1_i1.p1 TRINITY_DN5160_c0_g1~~TRINITY_DN5160_c0_g1_i1.p1  ORF type:complete len:605 (-),score=74.39 TRINITY_DN5160_c0_g1_i1:175-1719(-)